jgi:hypothetical protein
MSISPRITTENKLYHNQRFHETEQQQHIYNNSNFLLSKMSPQVVLRNSKPDSFTMLSGTVEKSAQFTSAQQRFMSSVSDWTHLLDTSNLPVERIHFSTPTPPPIYFSLLDTS